MRISNPKRWLVFLIGLLTIGAAASALVVTVASGGSSRTYTYVRPTVPPGLILHQPADKVEKQVLDSLGPNSRIYGVSVVASRVGLPGVVPALAKTIGPGVAKTGPAWIVRANGMFQRTSDPPGDPPLTTPRNGWVVIDDTTGVTLAYGWGH